MLEPVAIDRIAQDEDGPVGEEGELLLVLRSEGGEPVGRWLAGWRVRDPFRRFWLIWIIVLYGTTRSRLASIRVVSGGCFESSLVARLERMACNLPGIQVLRKGRIVR